MPEPLGRIQDRIDQAARRSGRSSQEITLVAVTKTVPLSKVLPFIDAGVSQLGENRVQEALEKYQSPDGTKRVPATMHLIGHLQTNKAKKAAAFFDMIQSLDRWELAEDLQRHAASSGKRLSCLIEIKISDDETKSGLPPEHLDEFLASLRGLPALDIQGLMGIASYGTTGETARPAFAKLRRLFEKTKLKILSMGMSGDFETAIEEGATMVRIGTALFGARA